MTRLRALAVAIGTFLGWMLVATPTAHAAAPCYASGVHAGYSTYTCHIWRTDHPWNMYDSGKWTGVGNVRGVLNAGNSWFVCQRRFGITLHYGGDLRNNWFAHTLSDNGLWGWVNGTHFSAGRNMEPIPGLGHCPAGFGNALSYPGDNPKVGDPLTMPGPDRESKIEVY